MPASTFDPVNAALRSALSSKGGSNNGSGGANANLSSASHCDLHIQIAGCTKKALLGNIDFEPAVSYQNIVLDKLKSKYIVLKAIESSSPSSCKSSISTNSSSNSSSSAATFDHPCDSINTSAVSTLASPRRELYPLQAVQLGWNDISGTAGWTVGAGMVNMGNTCYLNSTLQALFHVPALVNWLVADREHIGACDDLGACIVCAMCKTLHESQKRDTPTIRPHLIVNKLRLLCRNFLPGRQEDAHEFLRYLVEAMEKSFLNRFKHAGQLDARTKETTPLNQILGGYLRSAVRCLLCSHISTTFQHFQDLLLDIRKAQTLDDALDGYFSREKLDDDSYHCEACQRKVPATKQFSLERAPMVLCIQLKRFSVTNNKISKHLQFRQRLDLTRYSRTTPQRSTTPLVYRLVAMVTHMGPAVSCGHYTAVAQAPCGNFYQFDDSMVRPISHQAVFNTNAYIMFYELESAPFANSGASGGANKAPCTITSGTLLKQQNGHTSSVPYGPDLPPAMSGDILTNGLNKKTVMISSGDVGGMTATSPVATVTSSNKSFERASMPLLNGGSKLVQGATALVDKNDVESTRFSSSFLSNNNTNNHVTVLSAPTPPVKKPPLTPAPSSGISPFRHHPLLSQPPPLTPAPTTKLIEQQGSTHSSCATKACNKNKGKLKLVPYEDDDDDDDVEDDEVGNGDDGEGVDEDEFVVEEDEDDENSGTSSSGSSKGSTPERPTVGTKAANKDWQVVGQAADVTPARLEYNAADRTNKAPLKTSTAYTNLLTSTNTTSTAATTTTELMRMGGHSGYGQSVSSWSGARSALDRQVAQERRDERKRGAENELETAMDAGRVKQARKNGGDVSNELGAVWSKSNPGYNPIQEFCNAKNWNKQTGTYNRSFYSGNKHRNNNRRNFHQKNGYHNKHRYRP